MKDRVRIIVAGIAAFVLMAAAVWWWHSAEPAPAATTVAAASVPPPAFTTPPDTVSLPDTATPPVVTVDDPEGGPPEQTWAPADQQTVFNLAVQAVTVYTTIKDEQTFLAALQPLMTPDAWQDYRYTDPANVPVSAVNGPPVLSGPVYGWYAQIQVPTSTGIWLVTVVRDTQTSPWLVQQITPPEGIH